ncbi:uncharacterized protein [Centruroides vittatus]|uniref:uncharacterized protein n=1 Tax=Centruroides vittatus TaxID=120091 RepID=UPI00350FAC3F
MRKYFFVVLILAVGIDLSHQEDKCHSNKLQDCLFILTTYAKEHDSPFPRNEEELKLQCSYLEDMRNCVYNYSRVCMTDLERSLGDLILAGTAQSMKDMCNPSHSLYQNFLEQAECINDKYGGTKSCFEDAFATIEVLEETKSTDRIHILCCGVNRFRKCVGDYFEPVCSKSVVEFIDTILEFVATEFALQICTSYEDYKQGCPKLPSGEAIKGTYKNNLLGEFLDPFYRA